MFSTVFITLSLIAKPINDGGCDQLSETFQDREAFSFLTQTRLRKEFIQDRVVTRASTSLSSAETSLCCGKRRLGRKKKRASGARWKGEREKRGSSLFPLPIVPRALSVFSDYRVIKCHVIKMKFLKLWNLSGYSERTISKRPTCQK